MGHGIRGPLVRKDTWCPEALNVGGCLSQGDTAFETDADFHAVSEHLPARVRGEWPAMRRRRVRSVCALASQEGSHAGYAGVGVVRLSWAPLALPTFATTAFRRFFDSGCLIQCASLLVNARRVHLVVVYGFQGADEDAEKLCLSNELFDAALCELAVVGRGQPCVIAKDFQCGAHQDPLLVKRGLGWALD